MKVHIDDMLLQIVRKWSTWLDDDKWWLQDQYIQNYMSSKVQAKPTLYPLLYRRVIGDCLCKCDGVGGIIVIQGPRRVGKTTLLRYLVYLLLKKKVLSKDQIVYLSLDDVDLSEYAKQKNRSLCNVIREIINTFKRHNKKLLVILDEVTFYSEWSKCLKNLADDPADLLRDTLIIVTGSCALGLTSAKSDLAQRHGNIVERCNLRSGYWQYHDPLSFYEIVYYTNRDFRKLIDELSNKNINSLRFRLICDIIEDRFRGKFLKVFDNILKEYEDSLRRMFDIYLCTGGFPYVINWYLSSMDIERRNLLISEKYSEYARDILEKDARRVGIDSVILKQIVRELTNIRVIGSMLNLRSLASRTLRHPLHAQKQTGSVSLDEARKCIEYLESIRALILTYNMDVERKHIDFKFEPKIEWRDPFILASLYCYSRDIADPYLTWSKEIEKEETRGKVLESITVAHATRLARDFTPLLPEKDAVGYTKLKSDSDSQKSEKEIDVAVKIMLYREGKEKVILMQVARGGKRKLTEEENKALNQTGNKRLIVITEDKYKISQDMLQIPFYLFFSIF